MSDLRLLSIPFCIALIFGVVPATVWAQGGAGGKGRGPRHRGGRPDSQFQADRNVFRFLLSNHDQIRRTVTPRRDGVETLTESDNPKIASRIQEHVAAMYKRVEEQRPIRRRDPLFNELFRHADQIEMKLENTAKGVKVVETSPDPYVVQLIQEHAKVVSLFVKHGHAEARKDHAVPAAARGADTWDGQIVQYGIMHQVLAEGRHQGRIELGKLAKEPHCYAVGALANLAGEVTVADGRLIASLAAKTGTPVSPPEVHKQQATMVVAARVPSWIQYKIKRDIAAADFERIVHDVGQRAGLDTSKPFPFVVEGKLVGLEMHVIHGACPIHAQRIGKTVPEDQQPYRASLEQIEGELIGFYAEGRVGDLTCHGSKTHTHVVLRTAGGLDYTGHVERVGIKAGAVLRLPRKSKLLKKPT